MVCNESAEEGRNPCVSLILSIKSALTMLRGLIVIGFFLVVLEEDEALDWMEAASDATEVSSSLSVSVRSRGRLITGAPSKNWKGSSSQLDPKKVMSTPQRSLQSTPANAIVMCCKASLLKAAAQPSSLADKRSNRSDWKKEGNIKFKAT